MLTFSIYLGLGSVLDKTSIYDGCIVHCRSELLGKNVQRRLWQATKSDSQGLLNRIMFY